MAWRGLEACFAGELLYALPVKDAIQWRRWQVGWKCVGKGTEDSAIMGLKGWFSVVWGAPRAAQSTFGAIIVRSGALKGGQEYTLGLLCSLRCP